MSQKGLSLNNSQSSSKEKQQIGEILLEMKLISEQELERGLQKQASGQGGLIGEILIDMKLISERELLEALSRQWDLPVLMPVLELIDLALLEGLDLKYIFQEGFLPISKTEQDVTVVMSNPHDETVLTYLEKQFSTKVTLAITTKKAVQSVLKEYYQRRKLEQDAMGIINTMRPKYQYIQEDAPQEDYFGPSSISGISLYAEEEEAARAAQEESAKSEAEVPAQPVPVEPPPVEDNLIVGGVSLSSGQSEYKQQEGMLNYLIKSALLDNASALHIEPQGMFIRIRYRMDGVMHQKTALPATLGNPMAARLKQICSLNPDTTHLPQRNRVQASFNDQQMELGVATYPGPHGETMVLNLRQKQAGNRAVIVNLEQAGFSPLNLWRFKKVLSQPGGIVVVTGPARSGKSSTVYAALNTMNLLTRSISTAESPIEQSLTGVNQGNWTPESGFPFSEMIRSMSYLDSDVLMVSEFDSPETIEASVELALGGAKVITTYPSFDSMGALLRLKTQGIESFLIASRNITLISQRMVRKLCPACRYQERPHRDHLYLLGLVKVDPEAQMVWSARGCSDCQQLGYVGQTALHEILTINEAMREALLDQQPAAKIRSLARNEAKLISMAEDGYYKAVEGITSLAEVQRVAYINEYDSHSPRETLDLLASCRGENNDWF